MKVKWARSKIVVCFLIVTMLSASRLENLAIFQALGRINTMIAIPSAYATDGAKHKPRPVRAGERATGRARRDPYPDCAKEEALVAFLEEEVAKIEAVYKSARVA